MAHKGHLIRVIVFLLAFAFGIIGLAAGINCYVKSNKQKSFAKSYLPTPDTELTINTRDLFRAGVVLTVGCGNLAGTALLSLFTPFAFLAKLESVSFLFWTVWIFAADVANTVISRNREAIVSASVGGVMLPSALVQSMSKALGLSPVYWTNGFVRFYAIVTWITFLFGALATTVSFRTSNRKSERMEQKVQSLKIHFPSSNPLSVTREDVIASSEGLQIHHLPPQSE